MDKNLIKLILIYAFWLVAAITVIFSSKVILIIGFAASQIVLGLSTFYRLR